MENLQRDERLAFEEAGRQRAEEAIRTWLKTRSKQDERVALDSMIEVSLLPREGNRLFIDEHYVFVEFNIVVPRRGVFRRGKKELALAWMRENGWRDETPKEFLRLYFWQKGDWPKELFCAYMKRKLVARRAHGTARAVTAAGQDNAGP